MNIKALRICIVSFLLLSLNLILAFVGVKSELNEQRDPSAERILYDQRQTGNGYNIHISIKDVAIIEMDQNDFEDSSSNGEDYYYDEEDLTVKPLPSWLIKPPAVEGTTSKPLDTSTNNKSNCTNFEETNNTHISSVSNSILSTTITTNPSNQTNTISPILETLVDRNTNRSLINSSDPEITEFAAKSDIDYLIKKSNKENNIFPLTKTEGRRPQQVSRIKNVASKNLSDADLLLINRDKSIQIQNSISIQNKNDQRSLNDTNKIQIFSRRRTPNKSLVAANYYPIPYHSSQSLPSSSRERRCHIDRKIDSNACQIKRSSSILRRLFRLLMALPQGESKMNSDIRKSTINNESHL